VFHEWFPDGSPDGVVPLEPDLEDVCIVADLASGVSVEAGGQ
jgi:hypothetical protein